MDILGNKRNQCAGIMSKFLYSSLFLFVFCMADFVHAETINGSAVATIKRQVYVSKMQETDLGIILRDKWIKGKNISDKVRTNQFKVRGVGQPPFFNPVSGS